MIKLDVSRFQPGYRKPPKPVFTDGDALSTASQIMERVELTGKRMELYGEGFVQGNSVQVELRNHEVRNGAILEGHCFADSKTGRLHSLKAEFSREGMPTSHISYERDAEGKEVYRDSVYGAVVRSRSGALLQNPDGTFRSKLY